MADVNVSSRIEYSTTGSVRRALEEGLLVLSYVGTQDYYECLVCHRGMSGSVPAQAHLKGTPHLKSLQNCSSSSVGSDADGNYNGSSNGFDSVPCPAPYSSSRYQRASSPVPSSKSRSMNTVSDAVESAVRCGIVTEATVSCQRVFTCVICKITCTGKIPMNQHLCGESHCKKQSKMMPVARRLEAHSLSSQRNSFALLPALPSPIGSHYSLSSDDASPDKDLVQSSVVDGIGAPAEEGDFSNLTCEVCQVSCSGVISMKQHLLGNLHQKMMGCNSTSAPWQSRRTQHENERDSSKTSVKGKATKRNTQSAGEMMMINNEPNQLERQPCSTSTLWGTRTDLTTLQHREDLSEESVLGDLKETMNELFDKFTNCEIIIKKLDERISSVESNTLENFARQDSEISQLSAKCAVQDSTIAELEKKITFQNGEITHLKNVGTIKDKKMTDLLKQIKQLIDQHVVSKDEINDQYCFNTEWA